MILLIHTDIMTYTASQKEQGNVGPTPMLSEICALSQGWERACGTLLQIVFVSFFFLVAFLYHSSAPLRAKETKEFQAFLMENVSAQCTHLTRQVVVSFIFPPYSKQYIDSIIKPILQYTSSTASNPKLSHQRDGKGMICEFSILPPQLTI